MLHYGRLTCLLRRCNIHTQSSVSTLLVSDPPTIQIRLSALAGTIGVCLIAIIAAVMSHVASSRDIRSRDLIY